MQYEAGKVLLGLAIWLILLAPGFRVGEAGGVHGDSLDSDPSSPEAGPSVWRAIRLEDAPATSANASVGDLDGDGDLDIVLAKGRHWPLTDSVLFNDGAGGFSRRMKLPGAADRTYTAALADLDGDGDLDLVVGNDRPDDKRIYTNDGRGRLSLSGTFGEADWPTRNVTVADLDGDRRPEIIVANRGGPDVSANYICRNQGDGIFTTCDVLSSDSATTIAAGDVTGDGWVDLVVPHRDGGQSYLYINDGEGRFPRALPVGSAPSATRAVALGDIDGDGRLDLVLGVRDGGVTISLNEGEGMFGEARHYGGHEGEAYSIAIADLDADGDGDVVVGNRGAAGLILRNEGDGRNFRESHFGDASGAVYGLAIGDLDGDGILDIVAARSEATNTLYLGDVDW